MASYTIGQVAERTGVPATALRYYESIGLVTPSARSAAGYRLYDDRSLARLAFVARAKQLGCTLDEVAELVALWDGDRCGPVQRHLHALVTAKARDTERRIAELRTFGEQLRSAADQLAGEPVDGPCDEGCICAVERKESVPIACTIGAGEVDDRIALLERLRDELAHLDRGDDGTVVLRFPATTSNEAELRRFITDEQRCCAFWSFDLTTDDDGIDLRWGGPSDARHLLDQLHDFFAGSGPLTLL